MVYLLQHVASHFFLSRNVTEEERRGHVEAIISELGLGKARDTIVGDDKIRGVSGISCISPLLQIFKTDVAVALPR
jgi:hypothetical protein